MKKSINNYQPSVLLLIVLVGFPQISETIFTPSLPEIAKTLEVSMAVIQLTMSIYFFAFAFGVFYWGWLSDMIGRRPAILYGIVIYSLGCYLCYAANSIGYLLFARFIQAFGASTGSITTQTILRESYQGAERHRLFAQISAALAFTPAIGPLIGGYVGEYWGVKRVFLTLVVFSVFLFCYAYFQLPETRLVKGSQKVKLKPIFKEILKSPKVLTYGCLIGGINGIIFSYYAEAPYLFTDYFSMSLSHFGMLGILVATASIIGSLVSKKLLAKQEAEETITQGLNLMILGSGVLLSFSIGNGLKPSYQMIGMLLGIFILLIGAGMVLPNCLSLALIDFKNVIGSAGAIFSLGYYFLVSGLTLGMSLLHSGSLVVMPVYFLIIILLMKFMTKRYITN